MLGLVVLVGVIGLTQMGTGLTTSFHDIGGTMSQAAGSNDASTILPAALPPGSDLKDTYGGNKALSKERGTLRNSEPIPEIDVTGSSGGSRGNTLVAPDLPTETPQAEIPR